MPFEFLDEGSGDVSAPLQVKPNISPDSVGGAPKAQTPDVQSSSFDFFPEAGTLPTDTDLKDLATSGVSQNPALRAIYEAQQNRTFGQKAAATAKGFGEGLWNTVKAPVLAVPELIQKPSWEHAGRTVASVPEGVVGAASGLAGMIGKPLMRAYNLFTGNDIKTDEQNFEDWKLDYLAHHDVGPNALPTSVTPDWMRGGVFGQKAFEPYPNLSSTVSTAASIPFFDAAAGASGLTKVLAPSVKTGAASTGAKVAEAASKGAIKTGEVMEAVGSLPERASEAVAEKVLGPEIAGKVAGAVDIGESAALPIAALAGHHAAAAALGVVKGLEKGGQLVKKLGEFSERVAQADPASPFGRLWSVAKDTTAPEWMRVLSKSWVTQAPAEIANAAATGVKAATSGAIFGSAYGLLAGDDAEQLGQDIGSGAGFGILTAGATYPKIRRMQVMEKLNADVGRLYQEHMNDGVSPELLKNVGNDAMTWAAVSERVLGDGTKIRFVSPEMMPELAKGQAGYWDTGSKTLWIDPTKRDPGATVLHEVFHPLFDSEIANRPDIKSQIDEAMLNNGQSMDMAKQIYAYKVLAPEFKAQGITDPTQVQQRIGDWVNNQDATFAKKTGDPNSWIYSEILSEAAARSLYGEHPVFDVLSPSVSSTALQGVKNFLTGLGVEFKEKPVEGKPATAIPGFENVIDSAPLRKMTYSLLRAQKEYFPGLTKGESQGVKLDKEMVGKHPSVPAHDLGNGVKGNDYYKETAPGSGKFEQRPRGETSRILKSRRKEVNELYPPEGIPLSKDDQTPDIRLRRTPSGLVERSGTQLGEMFSTLKSFGEDTKAMARDLEQAIANGEGRSGWYQQIGESPDWKESVKKDFGALEAQYKDFIPFNFLVDKQGNLLVRNYSLTALDRKAAVWAGRTGPLSLHLWGGDIAKFKEDVARYLENHSKGLPGDANNLGADKKNTINAFLVGGNRTFEESNPLRKSLKGADRQGIVRSYRLDRLETVEKKETNFEQPQYGKQVVNLSPGTETAPGKEVQAKEKAPEEDSFMKLWHKKAAAEPGLHSEQLLQPNGQYSPPVDTNKEHIVMAALQMPDGKFFTGGAHAWAAMAAENAGYGAKDFESSTDGFMTSTGRFVDRMEAKKLAMASGQIDIGKAKEFDEKVAAEPGFTASSTKPLESVSFNASRNFSPQVDSPEFKKWFGESKVTDDDGKPLKLYHGTDSSDIKQVGGAWFTDDPHVADLYSQRQAYMKTPEFEDTVRNTDEEVADVPNASEMPEDLPGRATYPVYVKMEKPLDLRSLGGSSSPVAVFRKLQRLDVIPKTESWEDAREFIDHPDATSTFQILEDLGVYADAKKKGFDGVIISDVDTKGAYHDSWMPFSDNQVKSAIGNKGTFDAENPDMQFSPETQENNLVGVHNVSEEKLLHSLKMGGFPVPSLAITRPDKVAFDDYGHISLVAPKELVTPSKDTKVLNADAYSPRYPTVNYFLDQKSHDALHKVVDAALQKLPPEQQKSFNKFNLFNEMPEKSVRDTLKNSPEMMLAYLSEKGKLPEFTKAENERYQDTQDRNTVQDTLGRYSDSPERKPFHEWVDKLVDKLKINETEKIFKGYTYSGNRSYMPHNLENVVKIMKKGFRDAEGFNYGAGSVRATTAKQFRTLESIRASRDKIISKEEMKKLGEEANEELTALADKAMVYRANKVDGLQKYDVFSDDLKSMAQGDWKNLREQYPGGEPLPEMRAFLDKLKNMPTHYFEAKIRRGVGIHEFTGAVVPDTAKPETIKALEQRGLTVVKYPAGDSEARRKAVLAMAQSKQAAFSPQVAEPTYSQLEKVVDEKFSGDKMPAAQLAAVLRNPQNGVKAEEMKWSGLDDFLKGKAKVMKQEVQDFLKQNRIQISEKVLGQASSMKMSRFDWHESEYSSGRRMLTLGSVDENGRPLTGVVGAPDEQRNVAYVFDNGDGTWEVEAGDAAGPELEGKTNTYKTDSEAIRAAESLIPEGNTVGVPARDTKFEQYQLPGGDNYREVLFRLPSPTPTGSKNTLKMGGGMEPKPVYNMPVFTSSHWDEPNVLAHARVNDRTDSEGRPGLFVEEIQSDWHQQGRKKGYQSDNVEPATAKRGYGFWRVDDPNSNFITNVMDYDLPEGATAQDAIAEAARRLRDNPHQTAKKDFVPDAPLKTTWHEFVFRNLVRKAAETGKDWIGWTTGEQQAERYDLSKQVSKVYWQPEEKILTAYVNGSGWQEIASGISESKLSDYIGKEAAEKIVKPEFKDAQASETSGTPVHSLEGENLKVGGEGMKGFYDKILVDYANKFGKKFGAKVETREIPGERDASGNQPFENREKAVRILDGGGEVYGVDKYGHEELIKDYNHLLELEQENGVHYKSYILGDIQPSMEVHALPITPEMKKTALEQGFPMFSPSVSEPYSGALGVVDPDGSVYGHTVDANRSPDSFSHSQHGSGFRWRYHNKTHTVKWWDTPEQSLQRAVEDWLQDRGFESIKHESYLGARSPATPYTAPDDAALKNHAVLLSKQLKRPVSPIDLAAALAFYGSQGNRKQDQGSE